MLAGSVFDASGDGRADEEAQGLEGFHLWFHFFVERKASIKDGRRNKFVVFSIVLLVYDRLVT